MNDRFEYSYKVKTSDLWQASMYYAYSSYMGVVNAVFIVSAFILILSRWNDASDLFRAIMVVLILLFTVFRPVIIWLRARAMLGGRQRELTISFSREGLAVMAEGKSQLKPWSSVRGAVKKPTILIVYMDDGNGYILRNSVLKDTKNKLYDFINAMKK